MEFVLLVLLALAAAAAIALPAVGSARHRPPADADLQALHDERRALLTELRELDEDAAGGRISAQDRRAARSALAPRLLAVTNALHAAGEDTKQP